MPLGGDRPNFELISLPESEKNCNNTIAKGPAAPQVCRYSTLWNVGVSKTIIENMTTSVTTHFKSASSSSNA